MILRVTLLSGKTTDCKKAGSRENLRCIYLHLLRYNLWDFGTLVDTLLLYTIGGDDLRNAKTLKIQNIHV